MNIYGIYIFATLLNSFQFIWTPTSIWHIKNICIAQPVNFDLLMTHFAKVFKSFAGDHFQIKKLSTLTLSRSADVRHWFFFSKSNHTIQAGHSHLNTLLIDRCVRMVIQFLCTIVLTYFCTIVLSYFTKPEYKKLLTSLPYFTSYHSTCLYHFAMKMWKCRWSIQYSARCARKWKEIFWKKQHDWSRRS